jgi:TolA-binding protein
MAPPRPRRLITILVLLACLPSVALARDDNEAERALITANGLLRKGLFDLAVPEYQRYLDSDPSGDSVAVARYGLAVSLFRTGQPGPAGAQLDQIGDASFEFAPDALLLRAHCALAQNDFERVEQACADLARRFPDHASAPAAAALRCEALYRLDRSAAEVARAASDFSERFPASPQRARTEFFAGVALATAGDNSGAAQRFDWIVQHAPGDDLAPRAGLLLAQSLESLGQAARAEERYRRAAVSDDPTLAPDAFLGLARLDLAAGRTDDARRRAQSILDDFPESTAAHSAALLVARIACDNDRPDDGLAALTGRTFAEELQDDAAFWTARCHLVAGRNVEAIDLLNLALRDHTASELAPQMRFDLAVCLSRSAAPAKALAAFEEFRRRHPQDPLVPDASLAIASILRQQGEFDRAADLCEALAEDHPEHPRVSEALLLLAECHYQQEDFSGAAEACARALAATSDPELKSRLTYRMAMSLYREGAWAKARPLLESVVAESRASETFLPALHALGSGYFAAEQWLEAERRMTDYLNAEPAGPLADDALLKQGLARPRQGREAVESFDALIADYPASVHMPQALFERAQSLLALERSDEARPAFERVIQVAADSRFAQPSFERLGALAERAGDFTAAADWYARAGARGGSASPAGGAFDRGRALLASADYQGALDALTSAINDSPEDPRVPNARAQRAIALARLARADEALAEIESLAGAPSDALNPVLRRALRYEHAWMLRDRGDAAEAERLYRSFLDDPVHDSLRAHALVELGALLTEREQWQDAWTILETLRQADKSSLDADSDLAPTLAYHAGVCALRLDRAEEAITLLTEAAQSDPLAPSANLFAAEALMKAGRNSQAAERLNAAISQSQDPQVLRAALLRLGDASAALSDWAASVDAFTRWLAKFPEDPLWFQARFGIGWALENQGEFDDAIESYRQVVARHEGPTAARAQFQIGECLYSQGRHEDAVREFIVVDALYSYPQWSAAALYEAGRCLQDLGRADDARVRFKEVSDRFPDTQWSGLASAQLASLPAPASIRQADGAQGATQ